METRQSPLVAICSFIVDKRNLFFLIYILLIIFSLFSQNWVSVENDLSAYLSEDTETKQAMNLMESEYTTFGSAKVMVSNLSLREAFSVYDIIKGTPGVFETGFLPEYLNPASGEIAEEDEELSIDEIREHYNDSSALFDVVFNLEGLRTKRDLIASGAVETDVARRDAALDASVSNILDSMNDMDSATSGLSRFSSSLGGPFRILQAVSTSIWKATPSCVQRGDNLYAQLDSLSAFGRDDSIEVLNNLSAINSRFNSITDLLKNERDRLNEKFDEESIFKNASNNENSTSRIYRCRNAGNISGDIGVGGIVGTI